MMEKSPFCYTSLIAYRLYADSGQTASDCQSFRTSEQGCPYDFGLFFTFIINSHS
ncbi:hypothetical protein [Citrobacter pasteurii]|nr:hypothetical protein [Citrobacter pasteurii]